MSEADLAESHPAAMSLILGMGVGLALAFLSIGCIMFLKWYFKLRPQYKSSMHIFNLALLWIAPPDQELVASQAMGKEPS